MYKYNILKAIYTTEEFNALVEESVNRYLAGYRYLRRNTRSERTRLMAEDTVEQPGLVNKKEG